MSHTSFLCVVIDALIIEISFSIINGNYLWVMTWFFSVIMLQKMVRMYRTPIVARTGHQQRRLRSLMRTLCRMKLSARVRIDDLDRILHHVIRFNRMMQECIWHGGLSLGRNDILLLNTIADSFRNPGLRYMMLSSGLVVGNYGTKIASFFIHILDNGARTSTDPHQRMTLRRGRTVSRFSSSKVIYDMPQYMVDQLAASIPVTKRRIRNAWSFSGLLEVYVF